MPKFIVIFFYFFFSFKSFGQVSSFKKDKAKLESKKIEASASVNNMDGAGVELLAKDNLFDFLSFKASNLINESLLKKFKANV